MPDWRQKFTGGDGKAREYQWCCGVSDSCLQWHGRWIYPSVGYVETGPGTLFSVTWKRECRKLEAVLSRQGLQTSERISFSSKS
eukprot:2209088-Amphidinium_carterae.1